MQARVATSPDRTRHEPILRPNCGDTHRCRPLRDPEWIDATNTRAAPSRGKAGERATSCTRLRSDALGRVTRDAADQHEAHRLLDGERRFLQLGLRQIERVAAD